MTCSAELFSTVLWLLADFRYRWLALLNCSPRIIWLLAGFRYRWLVLLNCSPTLSKELGTIHVKIATVPKAAVNLGEQFL